MDELEYTQESERTLGDKIKRTLAIIGVTLGVLIIIAVIFVWYNLAKLSVNPLDFNGLTKTDGRTNVLVLGIGDPGHAGQNLSDTMMVISIDHNRHQVAMISIPRDLRVAIPGKGTGKINTANALGGPTLAEQTVANTLGIPIHYYILTDFSGLKQAVDAVGGLDIDVKQRLTDREYPCPDDKSTCGIDIKAGQQHMDGATVLQYTRCRKGTCGNDFGRAARQQEVIFKLQDKIAQPKVYLNPKTDAALLTTLRTYAKTDLSSNDLIALGWDMKRANKTINFVYSTAPGGLLRSSGPDLVPVSGNFTAIQNLAQNIFTAELPAPPK